MEEKKLDYLLSEESIRKIIAVFDEGEVKIQKTLAHYQEHGPKATYKVLLKSYTRSLAQMHVRRKWLVSLLPPDA